MTFEEYQNDMMRNVFIARLQSYSIRAKPLRQLKPDFQTVYNMARSLEAITVVRRPEWFVFYYPNEPRHCTAACQSVERSGANRGCCT